VLNALDLDIKLELKRKSTYTKSDSQTVEIANV
jgi:hypothetical protein